MTSRTIVYTPRVHNSPRIVDKEITFLHQRLSWGIEWETEAGQNLAKLSKTCGPCAELLIVDEAAIRIPPGTGPGTYRRRPVRAPAPSAR
jgi:hypothetical protein